MYGILKNSEQCSKLYPSGCEGLRGELEEYVLHTDTFSQ